MLYSKDKYIYMLTHLRIWPIEDNFFYTTQVFVRIGTYWIEFNKNNGNDLEI